MTEKDVIKKIIDTYSGNSEQIAQEFLDRQKIINAYNTHCIKLNLLQKEFNDKVRLQKEALLSLQKECRHWHREYFADPAGGSDSFTECQDCHKNLD